MSHSVEREDVVHHERRLCEDQLESLVDQYGVYYVLEALANVCTDKAEHLVENWQERQSSPYVRAWVRAANKIYSLSCQLRKKVIDLPESPNDPHR
jgi:hypothetical protein